MRRPVPWLALGAALVAAYGAADATAAADDPDYTTTVHAPEGDNDETHGRASSRVDRRDFEERLPRSAPDALRYEPGVFVQQTSAGQASVFVRGRTGQQTVLLFDGIRLNNSLWRQGPNQYFFTLDQATIRAIDVVRGSSSVRFGSDAIGGAVDALPLDAPLWADLAGLHAWPRSIFRASTADEQLGERFQLEAQWDRFGLIGGAGIRSVGLLEGGGAVANPADGELPWVPRFAEDGCTVNRETGDPENCRTQLGTGFDELTFDGRVSYDLGANRVLSAAVYGYREYDAPRTDQCPPAEGRWDECLTYDEQFRTLAYVSFRGDLAAGAAEDAHLALSYQRQHERRRLDRPASFVRLGGIDDVDTWGFVGSARTERIEIGAATLTLRYGGEVYHDRVASAAWTSFTDTGQTLFASRGQYVEGSHYTTGGFWLEPEFDLGAGVTLGLGGRFGGEEAHAPADEASGTAAVDDFWLTPVGRAGVAWAALDWLTLRANVDHAFRAPNLDDLTSRQQTGPGYQFENPGLRPEQALTVETGAQLRLPWLRAEAWGFWTPVWDAMARAPRSAADCPADDASCGGARARYQLVNLPGRADVFGVELSALVELPAGFSLSATLAWAWGEGPNPAERPADPGVAYEETLPLSRIPPLNGTVELRWRSDLGFYAGAALRWAALQDRLALQDLSDPRIPRGGTPGFAVLDLSAGYRFRRNLLVGVVLENVTDAAYRTHGSSVNGPGFGGSLLLEVGL
ncbi:MAG: TonB-dependent receptor [Deltaproteobacteria bacterium]|nr:TonB-dependent receptor [Deltaproteobacteria bacterium]